MPFRAADLAGLLAGKESAGAHGGVVNAPLVGFEHLDDERDNGLRREILDALFPLREGELAKEVFGREGRREGVSPRIYILTLADQQGELMEMARKPRLEFAGAIYHVLSRGNCRKELFDEGSAKLFEKTLFEVCRKCEWFLHAYVINE